MTTRGHVLAGLVSVAEDGFPVACSGTVLDAIQCDEFMSQNEVGNRSLFSVI